MLLKRFFSTVSEQSHEYIDESFPFDALCDPGPSNWRHRSRHDRRELQSGRSHDKVSGLSLIMIFVN
jgi:hypothetical protein